MSNTTASWTASSTAVATASGPLRVGNGPPWNAGGNNPNPVMTGIPNPVGHTHTIPVAGSAGVVTLQHTTEPLQGSLANINDKLYRYTGFQWVEVEVMDAPGSVKKSAPQLPITLDATEMHKALKAYHLFLDELEGLEAETEAVVDSVLFGLNEAIEALETLG